MDDLKNFCCQNPECPDYGQRGRDNLRVCFRIGPNKERRVLACRTCQQRFSERKGTPLYRCKLPEDKALSVLQHLQESCGVRQTSRLVGVNKNTVVRLALAAGRHAQQVPDERVAFSPSDAVEVEQPRTGRPGRPRKPRKVLPKGVKYATVHKVRENGRVVKVLTRVVFGTLAAIQAALRLSRISAIVNTVFIERHNGSDRNRNRRKVRKTCCFSKDWQVHEATTYLTMYSCNFCWPVRTLRVKVAPKRYAPRTPAMAAGLTDHVWTIREWATYPAVTRMRDP